MSQDESINTLSASVLFLLELASLDHGVSTEALYATLADLALPIRIVGDLEYYPALIVETYCDAARLCSLIPAGLRLEVVELRRHFAMQPLPSKSVPLLIADAIESRRAVVGAAAVERAIQRRKLDLLIIAADTSDAYRQMLRSIVGGHDYGGALMICEFTQDELGGLAGVRRAGCVGVLRGRRHVLL